MSIDSPILILTTEGSEDGHYVYYLATRMHHDDLTWSCILDVAVANFDDIIEGFQMSWGRVQRRTKSKVARAVTSTAPAATAAPGPTFDDALDAKLQFIPWQDAGFQANIQSFAPGLTSSNFAI